MKSFKNILFLIVLLGIVVNSCQKPERDNPWDELARLDPEEWAPNSFSIAQDDLVNSSLSWIFEDRNIEGFRIDRKAGDESWQEAYVKLPKTARSWQDSLISPDTALSYQYRVFAYAGKNTSAPKTLSYRPVFEAPSNLVLEKLSDLSYQLSWTNNTPWTAGDEHEQGFKIDRQTGEGNWELAIATLPPSHTSWVDTNVFAGREAISLNYRVYAFYKAIQSTALHALTETSINKPSDLTITNNSLVSVSLNWQNNSEGSEGFLLERSYDAQNWEQLQKNNQSSYTDESFDLNKRVYYRLAAYYGDFLSDYDTASFEAQIPVVEEFGFNVNDNNTVILNWQYPYAGHEGFYLEKQVNAGNWELLSPGIVPQTYEFEDDQVDLATNYYAYRISAFAKEAYSAQVTTSLAVPDVSTAAITAITHEGAIGGGNVISEGATAITARGIVWSSEPMPSLEQNEGMTNDGSGAGDFVSQISGLSVNSTYYVRAYAVNSVGISYGQELVFTTTVGNLAEVATAEVTAITAVNAAAGGNVISEGDTPVTQRGVCWSEAPNPTLSESYTLSGSGTGTFTSQLTDLIPGTTYYVRAYALNTAGIAYGEQLDFTTAIGNPPSVTTTAVSNISLTTATSGGNVTAQGDTPVTQRGVCWSTSPNPTTADNLTNDGGGTGMFISQLTGLNPGTTYYVRAYATNEAGTAYGDQIDFTTLFGSPPAVTTAAITDITNSTATGGGNVTSQGDTPVTQRGVCWSTSPNPTTADNQTNDGSGTGVFTSQLTELDPGVTYYVRAYAINTAGTSYGTQVSFNASVGNPPTVTTASITNISTTAATGGGNVISQGDTPVTQRGVCWSTSPDPTTADNQTNDGSGTGVFTSQLTGLEPGATYYVRAYAINTAGTSYGSQVNFTTSLGNPPTVTTATITDITPTTATGGGNVTAQGDTPVTQRGVCWSASPNPTTADNQTNDGSGTGVFTSQLTELDPGVTYYVRAYAINTAGTSYGTQVSFSTLVGNPPTVTTAAITNITASTATGGGNVTAQGDTPVTQRGVCWSTSPNPTTSDNLTNNGTGTGAFTSQLTGLDPGTTYYVRAYAINTAGTSYGTQVSFSTSVGNPPTVTTTAITNITTTTATGGGNVTSQGDTPVTQRGVCWSTSPNPTTTDNLTNDGSGTGAFTSQLTGLNPGVTYYVRAYAINTAGTSYGTQVSFSTSVGNPPTVTTTAITNITTTSATGGGNVTAQGDTPVTQRGVCWSTSPNPTTADNQTNDGSGTGAFTSQLTGLEPGVTYYVRAYAINTAGTSYGTQVSFNASVGNPPTVTTASITNISTTAATGGGNVTSQGDTPVTQRGVCWSTSPDPTTADNQTNDGSGTGVFTSQLTGLEPGATYYVRAYAINTGGTSYGTQVNFTTSPGNPPTVTTAAITDITPTTATGGGNVPAQGDTPVTQRGVCWSTSPAPTTADNLTNDGGGTGAFTSQLTGLDPGVTYYVRAYAINTAGTAYGTITNFTTNDLVIGSIAFGGIVFYLDSNGGGLVCAETDQSISMWGCNGTIIGNTSSEVGTGAANTEAIISICSEESIAAKICNDLVLNGYYDWFLPSKDELNFMYQNLKLAGIGGFDATNYWSSTEQNSHYAWIQEFSSGFQDWNSKANSSRVRAVRAF